MIKTLTPNSHWLNHPPCFQHQGIPTRNKACITQSRAKRLHCAVGGVATGAVDGAMALGISAWHEWRWGWLSLIMYDCIPLILGMNMGMMMFVYCIFLILGMHFLEWLWNLTFRYPKYPKLMAIVEAGDSPFSKGENLFWGNCLC